ncbi:hypothetical protein KKF92_03420 [Patescibacteria group bacterium]|nr:hypothetical protein [Patescibacteria group bacterium]
MNQEQRDTPKISRDLIGPSLAEGKTTDDLVALFKSTFKKGQKFDDRVLDTIYPPKGVRLDNVLTYARAVHQAETQKELDRASQPFFESEADKKISEFEQRTSPPEQVYGRVYDDFVRMIRDQRDLIGGWDKQEDEFIQEINDADSMDKFLSLRENVDRTESEGGLGHSHAGRLREKIIASIEQFQEEQFESFQTAINQASSVMDLKKINDKISEAQLTELQQVIKEKRQVLQDATYSEYLSIIMNLEMTDLTQFGNTRTKIEEIRNQIDELYRDNSINLAQAHKLADQLQMTEEELDLIIAQRTA